MKRLWKVIPPCMSDILGFEEVMNHTEGLGVVDDASNYKPLRHEREAGALERDGLERGGRERGGPEKRGPRGGLFPGVRVVASGISEIDIINGTEKKVLEAFKQGYEQYHPGFALFTTAPCASMINTDLEAVAEQAAKTFHVPSASVKLDGQKDYLYGISCTLETIGQLLLEKKDKVDGTVNLLGYNSIDWAKDSMVEAERWIEESGLRILSRWGGQETTANLKEASAAALNVVVNASGFRLARYMEREFGIPYLAGAPFGEKQSRRLMSRLQEIISGQAGEEIAVTDSDKAIHTEVLIVGEQMEADAIRKALQDRGYSGVSVMSFYEMDKSSMRTGDKKLTGESELADVLEKEELRLVIASADYKGLCRRPLPWIALPDLANHSPAQYMAKVPMVGERLDLWLEDCLARAGIHG